MKAFSGQLVAFCSFLRKIAIVKASEGKYWQEFFNILEIISPKQDQTLYLFFLVARKQHILETITEHTESTDFISYNITNIHLLSLSI